MNMSSAALMEGSVGEEFLLGCSGLTSILEDFDPFSVDTNLPSSSSGTEDFSGEGRNYVSIGPSTPQSNGSNDFSIHLPHDLWFHGQLSRCEAVDRLLLASHLPSVGRFLVRESDNRPGNFVFSSTTQSGTMHIRITALCGNYFAGADQYPSLGAFVESFVTMSLEGFGYPVPPPQPMVLSARKVIAVLPFCGMVDTDELSFLKGDIFQVHEEMDDGWYWVTCERTKLSGLLPRQLVEELTHSSSLANEKLPYFYPRSTVEELSRYLTQAGRGSFVVKPSESFPESYTLLVNIGRRIQKFRISKCDNGELEIGNRRFTCLHDVIERYRKVEILGDIKLLDNVAKWPKDVPMNEDVGKKLNLKRLSSHSSCPDAAKSGTVWRKSKESKKWKQVYLILKNTEGQLFCFDNEKRTKPKNILELCYCYLFPVDQSLFGRPNCFQLLLNGLDRASFFFSLTVEEDYHDWLTLLSPSCSGLKQAPAPFTSFRTFPPPDRKAIHSSTKLRIKILEAKNVNLRSSGDCYCVVSLNGAKVAKTVTVPVDGRGGGTEGVAVWDEEFHLVKLPRNTTLTTEISLYSRSRNRFKDSCLGRVSFPWGDSEVEGWFPLPSCPIQLRVRIRPTQLLVMPSEEYSSLKELLCSDSYYPAHVMGKTCQEDREALSKAMLSICMAENTHLTLLTCEISREIELCNEPRTLFRGPTFCSSLLNHFFIRVASGYLCKILRPVISSIMECKHSFQIDSGNIEGSTTNALKLVTETQNLCKAIFTSAKDFPRPLRYIFSVMKRRVADKWPRQSSVKLRAIGSFLFLRLFCVALVDPRKFHLVQESVPRLVAKNLVLTAKLLQTVANLTDSNIFSDYVDIEHMKSFIESAGTEMAVFLNEISSECEMPPIIGGMMGDVAEDLATIFYIAESNIDRLIEKNGQTEVVKRIISVVNLLRGHEKQYSLNLY